MGEDLIENKIYVAELYGSDLQGNDLYKLEPLKQIGNATFVKVAPEFKEGDFVYQAGRIMIVKSYPSNYHANIWHIFSDKPYYNRSCGVNFSEPAFRYATEEEKQLLIDAMKKDGKQWNAEKMIIEDIPQPKFKIGDKVRIKKGVNIGTNMCDGLILTVSEYHNQHQNILYCKGFPYLFREDWLEPYVEELKKGDLAIFWDKETLPDGDAIIARYDCADIIDWAISHNSADGGVYNFAVKWDGTKEQFEKILRGEI